MTWLALACAVFVSMVALEFVWVECVTAVTELRALRAGLWSGALCAIGLIGLLGVTTYSRWLGVPEVLGAAVGTSSAVCLRRRRR